MDQHIAELRIGQMTTYIKAPHRVVNARYLCDYTVWLAFNDGRQGVVDLAEQVYADDHKRLRDPSLFAQFYLDDELESIAWHDGVGVAPEYLYERLTAVH
jgi:hypothetical protein